MLQTVTKSCTKVTKSTETGGATWEAGHDGVEDNCLPAGLSAGTWLHT